MSTLALLDDAAAPEAFHMPIYGLYADLDVGEGSVALPDEFLQSSGLLQVEILQDWQRALEQCRRRALVQLFREVSATMEELPITEKLSRFRKTCSELGLECPGDLTVMLQQY